MSNICPVCGNAVNETSQACEMCGFKLVGTTQSFAPIIDSTEASPSSHSGDMFQLRVMRGQQIGSIFKLTADVISIGRNPNNEIFLNDMTVSRKHAVMSRTSTSYRIKDSQSFNGLWVNGKNVSEVLLNVGDQIQIGVFKLIFEKEH